MGRVQKSLKNISTGLINKLVLMFLALSTRTIFIKLLGAEYAGVSSLFTNILSVLSLAEMGIGNVLMFHLYGALKDGDDIKIAKLVWEFKKIYNCIIIAVLIIGCALIPFLKYIIKSTLPFKEIIVYYLFYLINSVASYFVIYRTMVISADQKSYITNTCATCCTISMYILQIVYLLISHSFIGYLFIQVMCTIANNVILNNIACKKYPYLRKSNKSDGENIVDRKSIFLDIKATFLFKVSDTVLDQTQNIIISIMIGTVVVGYYSNYYMIVAYLCSIVSIIASGLLASFGNLNAEGNKEASYRMFMVSMFLFSFIGIFCSTCYYCVIQDFIALWLGTEYLMDIGVVFSIVAVFYLRMITNTVWMYRSSMGLFKEVQYINVIAAILNIVLAILLGKLFGVAGIIGATAISRLLTSFWFESYVIFTKLDKSVFIYYKRQLKDIVITICNVVLCAKICSYISYSGIINVLLKLVVCSVVTMVVFFAVNYHSDEFGFIKNKVRYMFINLFTK